MMKYSAFSTGGCPTSEVRGRSREDPMPEGRQPRGVTPRPRSGAAAESARLRRRRNGREKVPHVRGQGGRPKGDTQRLRSGLRGEEIPHALKPEARGGRREALPHPPYARGLGGGREELPKSEVRGGSQEELPHAGGQGRWQGGATPHPRPGAAARRTNPTSK